MRVNRVSVTIIGMQQVTNTGFKAEHPKRRNRNLRGNGFDSGAAMKKRLRKFMSEYEIKGYGHLARLLGASSGSVVWNWFNTSHRPSSKYTSRLLELALWAKDGIPIKEIAYVDWDMERFVWKESYSEPRRYISSRDWEYVPDSEEPAGHGPVGLRTR